MENGIKLRLSKGDNPQLGDVYYDTSKGKAHIYMHGKWSEVDTSLQPKNLVSDVTWNANCTSIHIIGWTWWFNNNTEIIKWLDNGTNGHYNKESNSIVFASKEAATYFKLKWD